MDKKTKKTTKKTATKGSCRRVGRRHVESAIPGAKVIELVPDAFGTGR